ncbi:nuclear transport factor 2 family protein [Motilibacter aurantiacus]|uniref:nuclear transport factor 2 family protein n=1 Tax=Motilibacter aurantiacus TaxID=2714955 RepID=UPI00140A4DFC|nr:nuclear transport factor 2 family protein [Motilibacter aurantiacus]NHC46333.1 nuclear transport factor 2 family protein [Motilibacter aurantiacus]
MSDTTDLMRANLLEVFDERDPERRRAAIARTYAPDVAFSDPEGTVTGHAAVDAKAQKVLDDALGFVFSPMGEAYESSDLGYQAWGLGPAGEPPVVRGIDIALVADGRIARLYTLLLRD